MVRRSVRATDEAAVALSLADVPLGPWADAEVPFWKTKTGTVWHGDADCPSLTSTAALRPHRQAADGTLAERELPDRLHCEPGGELGEYVNAAQALVAYAAETREAERALASGDVRMQSLAATGGQSSLRSGDDASWRGLTDLWQVADEQRDDVVRRIHAELAPGGERMAIMALAYWIRTGRTPREHQARYRRFVWAAAEALEQHGIDSQMGREAYVNREALPDWLDEVVEGRACENATRELAQQARDQAGASRRRGSPDLPDRIQKAWHTAGERWQTMLEAMAISHPGAVVAIFQTYGSHIDGELVDACLSLRGGARLHAGHLDWTVAIVPAGFRLLLNERDRGLNGLVLLEEDLHRIDASVCNRFLDNLLAAEGHPELAKFVETRAPGHSVDEITGTPDSVREEGFRLAEGMDWRRQRFSSASCGTGITLAD